MNSIYAKAFVFALDGIGKLIIGLCNSLHPPAEIRTLRDEYKNHFGHLKHIRDSAIHIEDRGRGKTRNDEPLNASIIILGSCIDNRYSFTGENGKQYEIEISNRTLLEAKDIIQKIISSYTWIQ